MLKKKDKKIGIKEKKEIKVNPLLKIPKENFDNLLKIMTVQKLGKK